MIWQQKLYLNWSVPTHKCTKDRQTWSLNTYLDLRKNLFKYYSFDIKRNIKEIIELALSLFNEYGSPKKKINSDRRMGITGIPIESSNSKINQNILVAHRYLRFLDQLFLPSLHPLSWGFASISTLEIWTHKNWLRKVWILHIWAKILISTISH